MLYQSPCALNYLADHTLGIAVALVTVRCRLPVGCQHIPNRTNKLARHVCVDVCRLIFTKELEQRSVCICRVFDISEKQSR